MEAEIKLVNWKLYTGATYYLEFRESGFPPNVEESGDSSWHIKFEIHCLLSTGD